MLNSLSTSHLQYFLQIYYSERLQRSRVNLKYVHVNKGYCKVCQYILPVIMKISIIVPYHNIRLLNLNSFKMSILSICLSQEKSFVHDNLYWLRNLYFLSNRRLLTFNLVISNGNSDPDNYRPLYSLTELSFPLLSHWTSVDLAGLRIKFWHFCLYLWNDELSLLYPDFIRTSVLIIQQCVCVVQWLAAWGEKAERRVPIQSCSVHSLMHLRI